MAHVKFDKIHRAHNDFKDAVKDSGLGGQPAVRPRCQIHFAQTSWHNVFALEHSQDLQAGSHRHPAGPSPGRIRGTDRPGGSASEPQADAIPLRELSSVSQPHPGLVPGPILGSFGLSTKHEQPRRKAAAVWTCRVARTAWPRIGPILGTRLYGVYDGLRLRFLGGCRLPDPPP
jgi:hypothetical protein